MRGPALPDGVPQPLDNELLAWAAGFFDGEGSTIAKQESRRPGYRQLYVSVPQSGGSQVPEVLERFRTSALGTGRMDARNAQGIYAWRSRGRIDAEMTLALMWPYLGAVKRAQAETALALTKDQYTKGVRARRPRYIPDFVAHPATRVTASGSNLSERAWAAGFLDAEGWFGVVRGVKRKRGPEWLRIRVSAPQHSVDGHVPQVLERLHAAVGVGRIECHGEPDDFKWVAEGRDAVLRVLELTETWLGEVKLEQAEVALDRFDRQERFKGTTATTCLRGHVYDNTVVSPSGRTRKYCNACARIAERARRAARGGKPRQVRAQPDDPSRAYRHKQP